MSGKFVYRKFAEINLEDTFFDSLKKDYPGTPNSTGFSVWFRKKATQGEEALVYESEDGIGAFVYIKTENEAVSLKAGTCLPAQERIKLGTLKISDLYRGQRIGEGAIGLALWEWQRRKVDEIYVTVFSKQKTLIMLLKRFGFEWVGTNMNGEEVYLKSRLSISYKNPYTSFPFVNPNFDEAGYLIFEDVYHDTMFPYSELNNITQKRAELSVANGLSKIYISAAAESKYKVGEPVLIYRKYNGTGIKKYKSCVTSFGIVTGVIQVKRRGNAFLSYQELLLQIGNKSVFDEGELEKKYYENYNMFVFELLYYAFFGAGHNVNYAWLCEHNLWAKDGGYPTNTKLTQEEFNAILKEGELDVQNIIID